MAENLIMNENSVLSDLKVPYINGTATARVLSRTALLNIVQGQIERDGQGITLGFSNDTRGSEIRIPVQLPIEVGTRLYGGAINGGAFPEDATTSSVYTVGLPVLFTADTSILIPEVSLEMMPVDLVANAVKSYAQGIDRDLNAATIAGKFFATYEAKHEGKEINELTSGDSKLVDFMTANGKLNDGAEEVGVDMFPTDDRAAVVKSSYGVELKIDRVVNIPSSLVAEQASEGKLSSNLPNMVQNGYIGHLDGVPVYVAAEPVWHRASEWLGLGKHGLDNVDGYISSGLANVRAVANAEEFDIQRLNRGRGIVINPLVRFGFKVLDGFEKGNCFLLKDGFANPFDALHEAGAKVSYLPKKSRIASDLVVDNSTAKSLTATSAKAKAIYGVKGTNYDLASVAVAANKLTSGTAKASLTTGDKWTVVAIFEDGTCDFQVVTIK